ncbi:hypothetical protein AB0G02_15780 [Actinosynnema sp. NPDC023658]|uniref:hypothetical protein n=1 Tax=Actinosynnema sp. NPDC023658 TaxID=3155465 RepID=UPI0033EA7978
MNAPQNPHQPQNPQYPQNWPPQPQQPAGQPPPGQPQAGPQQPGGYGPPPPGFPQPGTQQPGFAPPGGYGPPPPPAKKRTGLIAGIVIGVVVLVVAGVLGFRYLDYVEEPGGGPGAQPIPECELSSELKSQAHVSSFRLIQAPTDAEKGMKHSHCAWEQTKGKDGRNPRLLTFHVYDFTTFNDKKDRNVEQAHGNYLSFTSYANGEQAKPIDGLGDEAMIVLPNSTGDLTEVNLLVRKGTVVWNIRYQGHDKGFFTDSPFPVADAEAVARKTAEELTAG